MTNDTLLSSGDVVAAVGHGLTYPTLHRWSRNGAVHPTQPARGSGTDAGWSHRDVLIIEAIATVRQDLAGLGLPCPRELVADMWGDLQRWGECDIYSGTVHINVTLTPDAA